mmetsp:Transcript_49103/g.153736  ORF Transcript_49103/g.153736 Transcript_49103/m.153736 type:complete len:346 (-) Transcript_49103:119-1156(-)
MTQDLIQRQAVARLLLQDLLDQVAHADWDEGRKLQLHLQDLRDEHDVVRALEWWTSDHHFVKENPQTPDVQGVVVATTLDHLRGQVVESPAEGRAEVARNGTPAKVGDLEHVFVVDEEVLRLQVAVHDALGVQVAEAPCDLHKVVLGHVFCESATSASPQQLVQLALRAVLQQQIHCIGILKVLVEPQHILVLEVPLNLHFSLHLVDQVSLDHLYLPHGLEGVNVAGSLPAHSANNTEGSLPQGPAGVAVEDLELVEGNLRPWRCRPRRRHLLGGTAQARALRLSGQSRSLPPGLRRPAHAGGVSRARPGAGAANAGGQLLSRSQGGGPWRRQTCGSHCAGAAPP